MVIDRRAAGTEPRSSVRVSVRFPVTYTGRHVKGTAMALSVSATGALLENAEPLLISGGKVRLRFSLAQDAIPVEVAAEVVRETETGFAVRFTSMDVRVKAVLRAAISKAIRELEVVGEDLDDEDKTLLTL